MKKLLILILVTFSCSVEDEKTSPMLGARLITPKKEALQYFKNLVDSDSLLIGPNLTGVGTDKELYYYPSYSLNNYWVVYPIFHNNSLYGLRYGTEEENSTKQFVIDTQQHFNHLFGHPLRDSISEVEYEFTWLSDSIGVILQVKNDKMNIEIYHERLLRDRDFSQAVFNRYGDSWDYSYTKIDTGSFIRYLE